MVALLVLLVIHIVDNQYSSGFCILNAHHDQTARPLYRRRTRQIPQRVHLERRGQLAGARRLKGPGRLRQPDVHGTERCIVGDLDLHRKRAARPPGAPRSPHQRRRPHHLRRARALRDHGYGAIRGAAGSSHFR